jgi:leucyl aminopeptidase
MTDTSALVEPLAADAVPVRFVSEDDLARWLASEPAATRAWALAQRYRAESGRVLLVPSFDGTLRCVVVGGALSAATPWQVFTAGAALSDRLPAGRYRLASALETEAARIFSEGWLHGRYRFHRYRPTAAQRAADDGVPRLEAGPGVDVRAAVERARALDQARDLINLPAADLGPEEWAQRMQELASASGASWSQIVGDDLLAARLELIHAVGRASPRPPRLLDLRWGAEDAPRVTLVGKGVCFDTGGLDLKPSASMLLMKKDMGGAAVAFAVARMLIERAAPVRLRLLIAAVDNSVSGNAYRPGDVLRSRKGLTVEINNTDAEGRLVLADALSVADDERPQLLLDFATLTGAARVALGPELPAVFSPDDTLLADAQAAGRAEGDPVWPLPLWGGYDEELNSRVADLNNVASSPFAGAIFGALFLRRFVTATRAWAHFDLFAWNPRERPGRPVGAEAQCARLAYRLIRQRLG